MASSRQLSTSIITFALSLLNFSVDLDDCVNHNCSNGASCIDGINSYSCNCSAGFTGLNCETGRTRTNKTPMLLHKLNSTELVKFSSELRHGSSLHSGFYDLIMFFPLSSFILTIGHCV